MSIQPLPVQISPKDFITQVKINNESTKTNNRLVILISSEDKLLKFKTSDLQLQLLWNQVKPLQIREHIFQYQFPDIFPFESNSISFEITSNTKSNIQVVAYLMPEYDLHIQHEQLNSAITLIHLMPTQLGQPISHLLLNFELLNDKGERLKFLAKEDETNDKGIRINYTDGLYYKIIKNLTPGSYILFVYFNHKDWTYHFTIK